MGQMNSLEQYFGHDRGDVDEERGVERTEDEVAFQ